MSIFRYRFHSEPRTIDGIFERVIVISLRSSVDRRRYISEHLPENGIQDFEFFDAYGPEAPEVIDAFASGSVSRFPPCFRCGKLSCGLTDCNNVLVPAQVANFATYLKLWRNIADRTERCLIIEDDVSLQPWFWRVVSELRSAIIGGKLPFQSGVPCLLRLGWAKSEEHATTRMRISEDIRMSNPCHAMTNAYASKLVNKFEKFDTTSDIFMHQRVPNPGEAYTIFPPIASELSWSDGCFASLIHPKENHPAYLRKIGAAREAEAYEEKAFRYFKHVDHRKFLIVGHPGPGTSFVVSLMRQIGIDIGHERDGLDGFSSWTFAVDDDCGALAGDRITRCRRNVHWNWLIHPVQKPETAMQSIILANKLPEGFAFRRRHILQRRGIDIGDAASELDKAVLSLVLWSEIIDEMRPDLTFQVETAPDCVFDWLKRIGYKLSNDHSSVEIKSDTQQPRSLKWERLSSSSLSHLRNYCERYAYPLPGRLRF